jgi:hypothetical protein
LSEKLVLNPRERSWKSLIILRRISDGNMMVL